MCAVPLVWNHPRASCTALAPFPKFTDRKLLRGAVPLPRISSRHPRPRTTHVTAAMTHLQITYEPTGEWYDGELKRFVRIDNQQRPPRGCILFVGSSIFREWRELFEFEDEFFPLPVVNRAFGGSTAYEQCLPEILNATVFPHAPRVLVYYCGSNDLNEGRSAQEICESFVTWSRAVRKNIAANEKTKIEILFVSINRAPQKMPVWGVLDETNLLIKRFCEATDGHTFIDVNPLLFEDAEGGLENNDDGLQSKSDSPEYYKNRNPKFHLFRDDGLHFQPEAYSVWSPAVKTAVKAAWERATAFEKNETVTDPQAVPEDDPYLPPGLR